MGDRASRGELNGDGRRHGGRGGGGTDAECEGGGSRATVEGPGVAAEAGCLHRGGRAGARNPSRRRRLVADVRGGGRGFELGREVGGGEGAAGSELG